VLETGDYRAALDAMAATGSTRAAGPRYFTEEMTPNA